MQDSTNGRAPITTSHRIGQWQPVPVRRRRSAADALIRAWVDPVGGPGPATD